MSLSSNPEEDISSINKEAIDITIKQQIIVNGRPKRVKNLTKAQAHVRLLEDRLKAL